MKFKIGGPLKTSKYEKRFPLQQKADTKRGLTTGPEPTEPVTPERRTRDLIEWTPETEATLHRMISH